jgi:hypothetical protein
MTKIEGTGSNSQRHGSPDPDLYQNVTDPQLWLTQESLLFHTRFLDSVFHTLYCLVRYSCSYLESDRSAKIRVQSQIFVMTGRRELGLEKGSKTCTGTDTLLTRILPLWFLFSCIRQFGWIRILIAEPEHLWICYCLASLSHVVLLYNSVRKVQSVDSAQHIRCCCILTLLLFFSSL